MMTCIRAPCLRGPWRAAQAMGIALVSLKGAEFMEQPRQVCQVALPMYKPEAHGQLLKLAKVRAS